MAHNVQHHLKKRFRDQVAVHRHIGPWFIYHLLVYICQKKKLQPIQQKKIYIRDSSQFKTVEAIQYKQYKIDTVMHAFQRTASKTIKFVSLGEIWENHCV